MRRRLSGGPVRIGALTGLLLICASGLFNVNNLKLARFIEIFPAAAKTDRIDARKGLELSQLREHFPMARGGSSELGGRAGSVDGLGLKTLL